jgi:subtilisin-like proprotein convertase family protein
VISDGIDQDCNGGELCYLDNDSDGYRPDATSTLASADLDCLDAREARGAAPTTDCNDSNAAINPGVDADADGLNACLDCVDSDNRIPGGTITVAGNVASVEAGTNALPDNQTRNFRANINLGATVSDMNVRINLTHTYDGDLAISLLSPAGTQVSLSNRLGGSGQNFTNTVFDDEASTAISAGSAPFTGSFRPSSTLNAVDGQGLSGNWRLRVEDLANIDSGSLISWSVEFVTACP